MTYRFKATIILIWMLSGCRPADRSVEDQVLVASAQLTSAWVKNFNPFSTNALWPTRAGIYEPLLIYNTLSGEYIPWLASQVIPSPDGRQLIATLRKDVKWSDGHAFTAEDVVFTFELLKDHKALDTTAVWKRIASVEMRNATTVVFSLNAVDPDAMPHIVHQMIVPKHKWESVGKPALFTNPTPVGTGPYTEVENFRTQSFEIAKNPHYWQENAQLANRLRMPAYAGNDTVSLALVSGEIDWAGHNLPLIEKTYVARDPEHFRYWFPPLGGMVFLFANTTKAPFDSSFVRRAINHAIDRNKIVAVGMSGYTSPADASGLSPTYQKWKCCEDKAKQSVQYDPEKARELLIRAGCQKTETEWLCQNRPLAINIDVVNGWSDWIRTAQLIAADLNKIGIPTKVKTFDFGAWFDRVQKGHFELSIGWSNEGVTPFEFFKGLVSSETKKPVDIASPTNWHRYADPEFDRLLAAYQTTLDDAERKHIVRMLQQRFIEQMPAIPLFPNPSWGTYSTRYFTGFPNAENPYAKLTPHADPERLLMMTRIKPRRVTP